jgi:hypothetical protein
MISNNSSNRPYLSLTELEAFDLHSPVRDGERRFLCPLCGTDKPRDATHRSFSLNSSNGLYHCKRCNTKGRLREFWAAKDTVASSEQAKGAARLRAQRQLKRAFEVQQPVLQNKSEAVSDVIVPSNHTDWRLIWSRAGELEATAGASYLRSRGLSLEVANASGVRFVSHWGGAPALVFPFRDTGGEIVALGGRCIRECRISKPASGPKSLGAFWAYAPDACSPSGCFGPLDENMPSVLVCEAPLDALSLAQAGYPSLALGGTHTPDWLVQRLAFRRVALAFDADEPGDKAAATLTTRLLSFGAHPFRLYPDGAKDWNAVLQANGASYLADHLLAV